MFRFAFYVRGGLFTVGVAGLELVALILTAAAWIWWDADRRSAEDYTYEDYKFVALFALMAAMLVASPSRSVCSFHYLAHRSSGTATRSAWAMTSH